MEELSWLFFKSSSKDQSWQLAETWRAIIIKVFIFQLRVSFVILWISKDYFCHFGLFLDKFLPRLRLFTFFQSRARFWLFSMIFVHFFHIRTCTFKNTKTTYFWHSLLVFGLFVPVFGKEKVCKLIHTKIPPTKVLPCPHAMWSIHAHEINNFITLSTNFEK